MVADLVSLQCFEAAAATLQFRAAARRMGLSPNAFSARIARLEDELGCVLFERTTRHVQLTLAGERLLPHVQRLLRDAGALHSVAREAAPRVELTLGTRYELGLSWLVPSLPLLEDGRRRVHLYFGNGPDLLTQLEGGAIDAMVTSMRLPSAMAFVDLHPERYVFVGAPALLAHTPMRGAHDAGAHRLLDSNPALPLFRYGMDALASSTWSFREYAFLGTIAAIRAEALACRGLAVLPRYFVEPDLASGRLREAMPGLAMPEDRFRLVWRQGSPHDEDLQALGRRLAAIPLC